MSAVPSIPTIHLLCWQTHDSVLQHLTAWKAWTLTGRQSACNLQDSSTMSKVTNGYQQKLAVLGLCHCLEIFNNRTNAARSISDLRMDLTIIMLA